MIYPDDPIALYHRALMHLQRTESLIIVTGGQHYYIGYQARQHKIVKVEKTPRKKQKYGWYILLGIKLLLLLIFTTGALINFIEGNSWLLIAHLVLVAISIYDLALQLMRRK
jgi:hypothetical protein